MYETPAISCHGDSSAIAISFHLSSSPARRRIPFYNQTSLCVMARLQAIGALSAFFEEQLRSLPEMAEPCNAVTNRGRLIHASSTELLHGLSHKRLQSSTQ